MSRSETPASDTISLGSTDKTALTVSQRQLMKDLAIPEHLTVRLSVTNLRFSYQKYLAFLNAEKILADALAAGTWVGKKPKTMAIVNLVIGRTAWFDHYKPLFSKVHGYPILVKWLEGGLNAPTNLEAWGAERDVYNFTDLKKFLDNGGALGVESENDEVKGSKGKGKKKASDKEKKDKAKKKAKKTK